MNGFSVAILFSFLIIWIGTSYSRGYWAKISFNEKKGKAIGRGEEFNSEKIFDKVFWTCYFLAPFGGILYLLGWWIGGNKGFDDYKKMGEGDLVFKKIFENC